MTAEQLDILTSVIVVTAMCICCVQGFRAGQELAK